jgi:hypothetical protein
MRRAMQPDVPPLLQRAHKLMAAGNYSTAAEAFEQLAHGGEARQHPRTGQMYLQAGRARILAGQKNVGFAHLKRGLGLMVAHPVQLQRAGERVVNELKDHGMSAEAQEIADWLKTSLPVGTEARGGAPISAAPKKPILPATCPSCGGVVRADDVDWLDEITAECDWCGSPIRAGG